MRAGEINSLMLKLHRAGVSVGADPALSRLCLTAPIGWEQGAARGLRAEGILVHNPPADGDWRWNCTELLQLAGLLK